MKRYIIFLACVLLLCSASCNGSASVSLSKNEEKSLVALGQLWGFLKYHHPAVAKGDYDWDMELIKRIPLIREAEDEGQWKVLLDSWLDSLPQVAANANKKLPEREIKMKPDYGELFNTEYFLPETVDKIRYILDNAVVETNRYVSVTESASVPSLLFTNEAFYADMLYPDLSYRLLSLFRCWNMVSYFFPYRELCDQKWSTVLAEILPKFVHAENQEQYIFACMNLVAKIDDSHGICQPNLSVGLFNVPFNVQFIEDQLVVTMHTGADAHIRKKIEVGDVITAIDGEPVEAVVKRMLPYTPASNYAVKQRKISAIILTGSAAAVAVTVQRGEKSFEVKVPRYAHRLLKNHNYSNPQPDKDGYRIIEGNIGYVLPSSCPYREYVKMDERVKKVLDGTKGVIVDMRCYPDASWLAEMFSCYFNPKQTKAEDRGFTNVSYPGYVFLSKDAYYVPTQWYYSYAKIPKNRYTKKVVVIVNEQTQSQAETHVMVYQTAPNVTVIGSTTAGADGSAAYLRLPGDIRVTITGVGVYYPDGSNLQRAGVKIDEVVKPTIAGIRAGRDELLERAIEIVNESSTN